MILSHTIYKHAISNEWVTFVHGAGGSSSIWYKQIRDFKEKYNVLILDLRGHGKSTITDTELKKYSFERVAKDVADLLDHIKVESSHFVGISLGSIIINYLAILHPERVKSMILGGTILSLNLKSRTLLTIGNTFKKIIPFIFLYQVFANVILPRKNHSESRKMFIREAKKLKQSEFLKWFSLYKSFPSVLKNFHKHSIDIPTLFIQGEQDHMFIDEVKKFVSHKKNYLMKIIENCGHVVNIEADKVFNQYCLDFLADQNIKKNNTIEV